MPLRIAHLFGSAMGLYGDRGNVLALRRRCEWRDIPVDVKAVDRVDDFDPRDFDIVFMGGGADRDQEAVAAELARLDRDALASEIEDGLVVLAVCGGYQFLGRSYRTADGRAIPGLDILPVTTESGRGRLVGPIEIETSPHMGGVVVGFENHGGRTHLLPRGEPFGTVLRGHGNNGIDKTEGCRYVNCIGTYLHGPILPQNPGLTDGLIGLALERATGEIPILRRLDDEIESEARIAAANQDSGKRNFRSRLGIEF